MHDLGVHWEDRPGAPSRLSRIFPVLSVLQFCFGSYLTAEPETFFSRFQFSGRIYFVG